MMKHIVTVTGPVPIPEIGFTLSHEHVMVDFIGAEKTGKHRYSAEAVVGRMLPYLQEAAALGVGTLIDCTPNYLGRDVGILLALARACGLHIVTNTGLYKDEYLPASAQTMSAEQLAEMWTREAGEGIEDSGIKPGFIKTAVNPHPLSDMEKKLITAAALTCNATGLPIATHTGSSRAAKDIITILEKHHTPPDKWIFVHAHLEEDTESLARLAALGVWIELDGLAFADDDNHSRKLHFLLDRGMEHRLLLSHDAGWYTVGEADGGTVRPYTHLSKKFLPRLRKEGIPDAAITRITVDNPAAAFAV
jgi:predicted metal-dependent phosphotriesterase family hydrolase